MAPKWKFQARVADFQTLPGPFSARKLSRQVDLLPITTTVTHNYNQIQNSLESRLLLLLDNSRGEESCNYLAGSCFDDRFQTTGRHRGKKNAKLFSVDINIFSFLLFLLESAVSWFNLSGGSSGLMCWSKEFESLLQPGFLLFFFTK